MRVLIGLGNPGEQYEKTRHNVGWMILDRLTGKEKFRLQKKFEAKICELKEKNWLLVKPMTFMNESGRSVKRLVDFYKLERDDLWVIHDDLDLPLGKFKIQKGVGPKGHRGVLSIEKSLVDKEFWRVRLGVDNRNEEMRKKPVGEEYVLSKFGREEKKILETVIEKVIREIEADL